MEIETIFFAAIQSSFILGLLHGVNPCGHSWLVLAPFVTGERNGSRVVVLTCAFLAGTALACLALGASLGAISQLLPISVASWVEMGTSILLMMIGLLLLYNPHILHHHESHDQQHHGDHDQAHCHTHAHTHKKYDLSGKLKRLSSNKRLLPLVLFCIGFVNMIIPCPTAAVMYGYALNSGDTLSATLVFGTYAVSTAVAVGAVIFIIYKATNMASSLQKEWVEPFVMRFAGVIIVIFSGYGMYRTITV